MHLAEQPGAGELPVPIDGAAGDVQEGGDLGDGETAEEAELDDAGLVWIELGQSDKGGIEFDEVRGSLLVDEKGGVELEALSATPPLLGVASAGGVHQHAPDGLGGDGEEVGAAFPDGLVLIHEAEVGLVHEGGGLEREILSLGAEVVLGDGAEFIVENGQEEIDRSLVSGRDAFEELGDVLLLVHVISTVA